jgi:hypothetical protein
MEKIEMKIFTFGFAKGILLDAKAYLLECKRIPFARSKVSFRRPKWGREEQYCGHFGQKKSARKFANLGFL